MRWAGSIPEVTLPTVTSQSSYRGDRIWASREGQVVVGRQDVAWEACPSAQHRRHRDGDGLAFARRHLGHEASLEGERAGQLDGIGTEAHGAVDRLLDQRQSLVASSFDAASAAPEHRAHRGETPAQLGVVEVAEFDGGRVDRACPLEDARERPAVAGDAAPGAFEHGVDPFGQTRSPMQGGKSEIVVQGARIEDVGVHRR